MDDFTKSVSRFSQNIIKTAANVITSIDDNNEESQEILNDLRNNLENYCKNIEKHKRINELSREITQQPEDARKKLLDDYCENISSFNPNMIDNKYLKEYDDRIAALMKNTIHRSQNDESTNEELQMEGNDVNLICPITKCKMTEPVKNKICGHVYDKSSVVSLLNTAKHTRCPIVGCSNRKYLAMDQIESDIVTQMCMERNAE